MNPEHYAPNIAGVGGTPIDFYSVADSGHKVHKSLESPITVNLLLEPCDAIEKNVHEAGLTPNDITSLSCVFGCLAVLSVWWKRPKCAALMYDLSYFCDCLDGILARKYDQATRFGDLYDHYSDLSLFLLMIFAIQTRYPMSAKWWSALVVVSTLGCIHLGNVETFNYECRISPEEKLIPPQNFLHNCTKLTDRLLTGVFNKKKNSATNTNSDLELQRNCTTLTKQMQYTKICTDIGPILLLNVYLLTRE
jgi:hypothetical protein